MVQWVHEVLRRCNGGDAAHENMEASQILDERYSRIVIRAEVEESFSFAVNYDC